MKYLAALAIVVSAEQVTFRSSVDVVSVPVSVTEKNRPVADLAAGDFELLDNDVKQQISVSSMELMPTDVTLVIDTSGSVSGKALERIKQDARACCSRTIGFGSYRSRGTQPTCLAWRRAAQRSIWRACRRAGRRRSTTRW